MVGPIEEILVLIVDDDPDTLSKASSLDSRLSIRLGATWKIILLRSIDEFLKLHGSIRKALSIAIVSSKLEDLKGRKGLHIVSYLKRKYGVRCILVVDKGEKLETLKMFQYGVDFCIERPINLDELSNLMESCIELKKGSLLGTSEFHISEYDSYDKPKLSDEEISLMRDIMSKQSSLNKLIFDELNRLSKLVAMYGSFLSEFEFMRDKKVIHYMKMMSNKIALLDDQSIMDMVNSSDNFKKLDSRIKRFEYLEKRLKIWLGSTIAALAVWVLKMIMDGVISLARLGVLK